MAAESELSIINPDPKWHPGPQLLHHLVAGSSDAKALEHTENRRRTVHTYKQLHHVSDAIAASLRQIAESHEGQLVVPVLLEQSPALYASLLGIMKAGGAFCPLNIDAPPERVSFILEDVKAPAVLVSKDLASLIPVNPFVKTIIVDWDTLSTSNIPPTLDSSLTKDDLAYVMYTSGSTGTPKGVGISHSAATQALLAHDKYIPSFARFLQFAAPTFDVSVFEIFFPLLRGSTLVSARRLEMLEDLPKIIRELEIDACELTPTVAGGLLKTRSSVPNLKLLLTIGEMLTEPVVREFGGDDTKDSMLWAMYGPTEATIHCTLQPAMAASSKVNNIGSPLDTVSCFVIRATGETSDFDFEILPRGEPGELVVGGHQLATGYLKRPEQNATSFISTPHGRLYRTGDRACMFPDGTIECLGRLADGQVKLRGQRIELGEVQEAILRTPGCHNAVAVVHESNLVAFCAADRDVSEDTILDQCRDWLPEFMIPSEVVVMTSLPKLPSGKADRKKLITDFNHQRETAFNNNTHDIEKVPEEFTKIVAKVLNCSLHSRTSLSYAGLDSLSAIQVSSALRSRGFHVDVSSLLRAQTLFALWGSVRTTTTPNTLEKTTASISALSELDDIALNAPSIRGLQDRIEDIIPCTSIQSAMLGETLQLPNMYWNEIEIGTKFGFAEVSSALRRLFEHDGILRAGFVPYGKGFASIMFKSPDHAPIHQVKVFGDESGNLLHPLQVQIKGSEDGLGTRLLFQIHHALYDGWSMDLLLSDLVRVMQGRTLQPRPQFRAIATYYHHPTSNRKSHHAPAKAFWAEHLLGWTKDPFPRLVGHSPTPFRSVTSNGHLEIPYENVQRASVGFGCSIQTLFQASLALVWSGILASDDIVLGCVTSGRTLPVAGIGSIFGPCIASLPLRIDMTRIADSRQLLNHVHSSNRAMMEDAILPLSEIRKLTEVRAGEALYDVLFAYQQSPHSDVRRSSDIWELRHIDRLESKLLIEVEPTETGFDIQATYHDDAMNSAFACVLIAELKKVFISIVNDSHSTIAALRRDLDVASSIYNPTPSSFEGTPDLAAIFEATRSRHPKRNAVCFANPGSGRSLELKTITYDQLNALANKIAHFLFSDGLGTRQVIGLIMEKSILMYASILAIVKIGCAYLPILPSTPTERIRKIFRQAKVRHCVVDQASLSSLSSLREPRLVDVQSAPLSDFKDHNIEIAPDASRLAYVIYTSGTTGEPKGVAVTQLNITSNIDHLRSIYPTGSSTPSRLLQACSQAFDVSVFEIFYAWHTGMCLCAGTNDTLFEDLEHAIRELEITHLSLTPTVAALIDPKNTPTVEFLVTAGEPLTHSVLETWGDRLWQGYGPSETTNICSVKRMQPAFPIEHLGWTFPNTSTFVMHFNALDPVPIGWVGEFCYGGDQVAQGYLNMPKLTSEQFVQHPKFGRIYRSGDMGRMLPDGSLVILGRLDDQLKLRGQRIEVGEINNVLTSLDQVSSSVTILAERSNRPSKQLVTFYVPSDHTPGRGVLDIEPSTTRALFSTLVARLPSYMVPSFIIPLAKIPLTASGKLHRRPLLDLFKDIPLTYLEEASATQITNDLTDQELTGLELTIATIVAEEMALEVSGIKRWTPFASLGIDSISAVGIARSLANVLKRRVPVSAIIRHPNVTQLSHHIETDTMSLSHYTESALLDPKSVREAKSMFSSQVVEAVFPCTPLQEAMLSAGSQSYYNKILLRLNTNEDDIKHYWQEMTRRHQILRTCFVTTRNPRRPVVQVVLQDWNLAWANFATTKPSFDNVIQEHMSLLPEAVDSGRPPVSFAAIRYRGSVFLSLICHHALYDAVAMDTLWREVEALANGLSLPSPVPYGPFIQEMLSLRGDAEQFWKAHLHDFQPRRLFASSKKIDQASTTKSLQRSLSATQTQARMLGVSILSLYQAAWAVTLALTYDTTDVCFGNVFSGRSVDVKDVGRLAAPTFNTVPIRTDVSKSSHSYDLLKDLQKLNAELLPYQFTPMRLAQKVAGCAPEMLFESLLLLQKPLHEMDDSVWILEEDSGDMDIPVVCEVVPCPSLNAVVTNLHYDTNTVDSTTAIALVELFEFVAEAMLHSPYAALPDRSSMPTNLREVVSALRPRKYRGHSIRQSDHSDREWTAIQLDIRQVFSDLSGISNAKITQVSTIFQLGLDSINAVQLASMLRQKGHQVSVSDVVAFPTCAKLGAKIQQTNRHTEEATPEYQFEGFAQSVEKRVETVVPDSSRLEAILPCTQMQCAMIQSCIDSGGKNYLNTMQFETDIGISEDVLVQAWETLFRYHPMLRTGFVRVDHPDAAFAMVRYKPSSTEAPRTVCRDRQLKHSLVETRQAFITQLWVPAWRVFLGTRSGIPTMDLCVHHALYDAESLSQILSSLSSLIRGNAGASFNPVEPGLSILMSRSLNDLNDAENFWKSKAPSAVINRFPIMTPLRESPGLMLTETITSSMSTSTLQEAAQKANLTIQAIIQASWTRILSSYVGEDAVVFGASLSGRTERATMNCPLPCLNTVPIIATNTQSNEQLLQSMMEYTAGMHQFQFAPLSHIQKWLGHPASSVFDTLISYRRSSTKSATPSPFQLIHDGPFVDYPVSLDIEACANDGLRISTTFGPDVIPVEQAKTMIKQFDAMMAHLALNPLGSESDLHSRIPTLYSQLAPVVADMQPPVQYLHQFVEQKAKSQPEAVAFEFVDNLKKPCRQWTYQELDELGNRVANMLVDLAPVNSIIAISFDKCPEAYFSILGILKAGCSFVALDVTAPDARKRYILEDSQAPCVLTSLGNELDCVNASDCKVVPISEAILLHYSTAPRALPETFTPLSTCYCLYTSGTTGTPKGCEITHDNVVHAMMAFQDLFSGHWQADSRWLQFAALHFDVSVLEQYWSWSVGITVVAAPKDLILDDLTGTINQLGITHIDLTPSLARLTHPDEIPSLCRGVFITGGESLKQEILDVWGPKAVIYNAYGPTEATIGVTMYQRVPINGRPSNIGKQFPNVGSYVFKPGTEIPVLRGGVGELCVSGRLVGKGYLNRPALTEERFPTLVATGDRVYRTGDLVRVMHDGCFDFLGRADDQVKLRGQRLEIGEINHVIRGVAGVRDAATVVVSQANDEKNLLVAFIVAEEVSKDQNLAVLEDIQGLSGKVRESCRNHLPVYMVPTYCLRLPFIPLSVNNKAEVKELRKLFASLTHEQLLHFTAASSRLSNNVDSKIIVQIVRSLAAFSNADPTDIAANSSIFDFGVDSISVVSFSTFLKREGLTAATPTAVLRNPVVADLAQVLTQPNAVSYDGKVKQAAHLIDAYGHRYRSLACRELDLSADNIEYIAPCSALQEGILSKSLTMEGQGAYFNSFDLTLGANVDIQELRSAWEHLVATESILRMQFVSTPSGFVQVSMKQARLRWEHLDLQDSPALQSALDFRRQRWLNDNKTHVRIPLELLLVQDAQHTRLRVHISHAIYDGNSFEVMLNRVSSSLQNRPLSPGPSLIEAFRHGPLLNYDFCRPFWADQLNSWAPSHMPRLSSSKSDLAFYAAQRKLSAGPVEEIQNIENVTLQSVILALWVSVLQQYFTRSLTLGVIVSGRAIDLPGIENTVGPLFNTLPFYNKTLAGRTWSSLIQQCHDFGSSILAFQHVSLQKIQKWCSKGRPLFDNLFALQVEKLSVDSGHDFWEIDDGNSAPDYPLALEVIFRQDRTMTANLVSQGHVADQAVLEEMLNKMEDHLQEMQNGLHALIAQDMTVEGLNSPPLAANIDTTSEHANDFGWDEVSSTIRAEVAALAGVNALEVDSTTTMLQLGLDSIDIIKLSAKLRALNVDIPASEIMRLQTIESIVANLEASEPASSPADIDMSPIKERLEESLKAQRFDLSDVVELLPATPLQESMVVAMVESEFEWYFNHDVLQIRGDVDIVRLKTAWNEVIESNPILRTAFHHIEDAELDVTYCQVVRRQREVWCDSITAANLDELEDVTTIMKDRAKEASGTDKLIQLCIAHVGSQNYLILSIAHALYDGWSLSLLYRELGKAYHGRELTTSSMRPLLKKIFGHHTSDSRSFWEESLRGCPPTLLPRSTESDVSIVKLEETSALSASDIQAFCKRYSVSLGALCQACWAVALSWLTKQLDITFGVVMSGRDFEGSEDLIFPTMNTVAFRCILHGVVSSFLNYVEERLADVRQHQHYPLRKAVTASGASAGGLFNTLFLLQKGADSVSSDEPLLRSVGGSAAVDYPICIEAEMMGSSLVWRTACQADFIPRADALELIRTLDQIMNFFVRSPSSDVLAFVEDQVSICGLAPIKLKSSTQTQTAEYDLEETWTEGALTIRSVLSQVSGVPEADIRLSNNLYHLGLDSISAMKVATHLRRRGFAITTRDIIAAYNIRHLIWTIQTSQAPAIIDQQQLVKWTPPSSIDLHALLQHHNLSTAEIEVTLPALPMQVYMLGTWQNSRRTVFYPEFTCILRKSCGKEAIDDAWGQVVQRTPILRTCFVTTGLAELPILQVILKHDSDRPMVSFSAVWDEEEHAWRLHLKIHHALYDGVSLPAIMHDLEHAVDRQQDDTTNLQADTLSQWIRYTTNPALVSSRAGRRHFWTRYLGGRLMNLPDAEPRTGYPIERVSYIERSALLKTASLRQVAARNGLSVQALFLAAYAKVLSRREGDPFEPGSQENPHGEAVVFGIYLGNRSGEDVDEVPKTFPRLNLVPLRVSVESSLIDVASSIQGDLGRIARHGRADVGLWEIAEWTGAQITSFVNFLSLPDREEESSCMEVVEGLAATEVPRDADDIGDVAVRNVFPPAIDVEASLKGDALDIGIFAPNNLVANEVSAAELVSQIVAALQNYS